MNDNRSSNPQAPAAGVVPIVGTVGPDGVVTLKRPLPRPPRRPRLRLVGD